MPTILEALRAVRSSDLQPLARHVLATLIGLADPDTCAIPDRYQPSLSELAKFTGLGRSTVAVQLTALEDAGWLKRDRPDVHRSWRDKERTRYFVLVSTSPGDGLVQDVDVSESGTSPGAGTALVREPDCTSPGAGHALRASTNLTNQEPSSSAVADESTTKRTPRRQPKAEERRPDVEQICAHLADRIEENGSPRPNITDAAWRREARLLLDDSRRSPRLDVSKVISLIDWCQKHHFWRSNIKSMKKFREQYDTLRLQALGEWQKAKSTYQNPEDQNIYDDWHQER